MRLDLSLPLPESAASQSPVIFRGAFVWRLLLYGTILSAAHFFVVSLLAADSYDGVFKFLQFPWVYLRGPLITHVVYQFFSPWNLNTYRYVTWFDWSGILANSALWGFSVTYFLLPRNEFHEKKDS